LKRVADKYLSALFKSYNSDQLNVAVLKGEIHLDKAELNEPVIQALVGARFMEIKSANCQSVTIKIPWKHLQSESIAVSIDSIVLVLEEPDEELELAELPPFLQRNPKPKNKKEKTKKSKPKRTRVDAILENFSLKVEKFDFCVQPRARVTQTSTTPILPEFLALSLKKFSLCSVNEKFEEISELGKELAKNKKNRLLTLRKLLSIESISVGIGKQGETNPCVKVPGIRLELEATRHIKSGIVHALNVALSIGKLNANFEKVEYENFTTTLEGVLWSFVRQTQPKGVDESMTPIKQEGETLDTEQVLAELNQLAMVDNSSTGDSSFEEEDDDENDDTARAAASSGTSATALTLQLLLAANFDGIAFELRNDSLNVVHSLDIGSIGVRAQSKAESSSSVGTADWALNVLFNVASFEAVDSYGATLIAQQRWSKGLTQFNSHTPLTRNTVADNHSDVPLSELAMMVDDVQSNKPDFLQVRMEFRLSSTAPLSTPMDIDVALHMSPMRIFLERGSLQQLSDVILSNVPALPPSAPREETNHRFTPPKRLAISLAIGAVTIYAPAPMSQPLTHDVRVVLGPILLASADASPLTDAADCIIASTTGEEIQNVNALVLSGSLRLGAFLVPVRKGGRTKEDSSAAPPSVANLKASKKEFTVIEPFEHALQITVNNYVATIQQFVNAPPKNIVLPRSHSINIVLNTGLAIQMSDAALASLVQGWFPVLPWIDSFKERLARSLKKKRLKESKRNLRLQELKDDAERRKKKEKETQRCKFVSFDHASCHKQH